MPPPTVKGMKTVSAVFSTIEIVVSRFSDEAVISKKVTSLLTQLDRLHLLG
jgi:hypothetical protein